MELATIHVSGVDAKVIQKRPVPVNIIGGYVDVIFDDDWEGLTRTAVIQGVKALDIVNVGSRFEIPQEAVSEPDTRLKVGFYGVSQDGGRGIPTLWADLGVVQDAADPSGDESTDPALPVWAQLEALIGDLSKLNTTAKETLVAAINEALTKGGADPETIGRIVEEYLDANPITAEQIGAVGKEELPQAINEALAQAKASGEFKGEPGEPGKDGKDGQDGAPGKDGADGQPGADGKDYVLTDADKTEIARQAAELVEVPEVDLTGVVKSVNGIAPDEQGNVEIVIPEGSGGAVSGTLLPETEVEPEVTVKGFGYNSHPVGEKLAVIMDGKPYITTHIQMGEGADAYDFIGNVALVNPNLVGTEYDTGEPFIGTLYYNFCQFGFTDGASHKVAICTVDELDEAIVKKLDLLENMSGDSGNVILPETEATMGDEDEFYIMKPIEGLVVGETYKVKYNGVEYECIAQELGAEGMTVITLGDISIMAGGTSTGEPFVMFVTDMETMGVGAVIGPLDGSTSVTVGIYKTEEEATGNFIVELTVAETEDETITANKTYAEIMGALSGGMSVVAVVGGQLVIPYAGIDMLSDASILFELNGGAQGDATIGMTVACSPENVWSMIQKAIPTMEALTGVPKVPTAEVGQTIRVSAVENGVPTAWEAVDFPSGGGGSEEWDILLNAAAEENVYSLSTTTPPQGHSFDEYTELIAFIFVAGSEYSASCSMEIAKGVNAFFPFGGCKNTGRLGMLHIELKPFGWIPRGWYAGYNDGSINNTLVPQAGGTVPIFYSPVGTGIVPEDMTVILHNTPITKISITSSAPIFAKGSKAIVYGKRNG